MTAAIISVVTGMYFCIVMYLIIKWFSIDK